MARRAGGAGIDRHFVHRTPSRDRTPWNIAERAGDERVVPVFRAIAKLRERLVPYLAEEAGRAVAAGEPLMRPLFFDAPAASEAFAHPYQWMLGDELLVAPVVEEGADAVRAWLPDGEWVDAFRGTRHTGGVVERDVPLDEAAVWIRAGAAERLAPLFTPEH